MKCITIVCSLLAALALSESVHAQYSSEAFSLKEASDLYDERGYQNGKALSIDGKLVISQSNGNVSYTYPISNYSVAGFPFQTTLTYAGSVGFTAFKSYQIGRDAPVLYEDETKLYGGWSKFSQNRPVWIYGVNGFAVQMLGVSSHFVSRSGTRLFDPDARTFDDSDLLFMCDGYDFANRMVDFGADASTEMFGTRFVDNIRLLRADGSVLELVHVTESNSTHPDLRPEVFTGYYLPMEANAPGYAVVAYDTLAWPTYIVRFQNEHRAALVARNVRYYPGDGLEYVFRESVIPYGARPYFDHDTASGGRFGGPTIFYLEEINSPGEQLQYFHRTRHHARPQFYMAGLQQDSTRGRATLWQFGDHTMSYGLNSMTIQAFGRTTQVKFNKVLPGGNATETDWMPIASLGIPSEQSREMATWPESESELYKNWLGYVTEIIDPMGRKTKFTYEPYVRNYVNFGFPHSITGQDVTLSLTNLRLKEIEEPTARYRIDYYKAPCLVECGNDFFHISTGSDTLTIRSGNGSDKELPRLSNMAARVEKRDLAGNLLTTDRYRFIFIPDSTFAPTTEYLSIDEISHDTVTTKNTFIRFPLPRFSPKMPKPQYTALARVETKGAGVTTVEETSYSVNNTLTSINIFGTTYSDVASSKWGTPFLILDTARATSINGLTSERQTIDYTIDTIRRFGTNTALAGLFGRNVTQRVTKTLHPSTGAVLLSTTTDYLHLPLIDTSGMMIYRLFQKLRAQRAWDSLKAAGEVDPSLGYEYAVDDPRTAFWSEDTSHWKVHVPPFFGLEKRTVVRDANGNYLSSSVKEYETSYDVGTQASYIRRGVLLRDSIIGTGGTKRLLGSAYSYRHTGKYQRIPSADTNANGARGFISPWYGFPDDWDLNPQGKVLDNRDSAHSYPLRGAVYGNMTNEPLAERRIVRRAKPGGGIDTLKLTQFNERTFFGLVAGATDYNGWFSRFDYDKNGRLATAWFPYDFQGSDSTWLHDEQGYDSSEAYGTTHYNVLHGVIDCDPDPENDPNLPPTSIVPMSHYGLLFADQPTRPAPPPCPECVETTEKGRDQTILGTCESPILFTHQYPATGEIGFAVVPPKTAAILSLDSAWLKLYVSSVIGSCVELEVNIPVLSLTRTYVLNCPPGAGLGGDGGEYLLVDLTEVKDKLLDIPPGQTIGATFAVTTTGGRVEFVSGYEAHDLRPQLMLKGNFRRINQRGDYTFAYSYSNDSLTSEISAKVDDIRHTASWHDTVALQGNPRRTHTKHFFGADGRLLKSQATITEPWGATRIDSTRHSYTGLGRKRATVDQIGDSVATTYDALGRAIETTNQDGTKSTIAYRYGTPASFGITGQDFFGFATATITKNEHGVKHVRYTDALGRVRREVADSGAGGHLNLTTKYDYDILGRLTLVVNPKGDSTLYWYDEFGRVKKKRHPDLNVVSYAYDDVGNVRYTQSQEQANRQRLTFNQYDDLNRIVLVGEANFAYFYNEDTIDISHAQPNSRTKGERGAGILNGVPEPEPSRYTDLLNPRYLHDDDTSLILTANMTLWMDPLRPVPTVPQTFSIRNCPLPANPLLGETTAPVGPFIIRPAAFHASGFLPVADTHDFEHLARYPEFPRIGIYYDTLPASQGPVWGGFPNAALWDMLAPRGTVRNLKGRESAVAYRERAGEPYHFAVMSYDERGRVEALLHFTENLGFDGIYYAYNALNQVTSVTVADLSRKYTTWYGYDANGRVDSVWTALHGTGNGLFHQPTGLTRYPGVSRRPPSGQTADIVYRYTKTGQVDTMKYPQINVLVDYAYNQRKWLDSLVATKGAANLFRQALKYHPTGQITEQQWQHGTNARRKQTYGYDSLQQLTTWTDGPANSGTGGGGGTTTTQYTYDNVGNRLAGGISLPGGGAGAASNYSYPGQANRLLASSTTDAGGATISNYWYNYNGSQVRKAQSFDSAVGGVRALGMEEHGWSFRELARRFVTYNGASQKQEDWRYRPNAAGEREQKRVYWLPTSDAVTNYPWVYYQLGGSREQLAVYHGQQTSAPMCNDTGRRVYLYPVEYLTYSISDISNLVTRPDGSKEYKVADHLGSTRVTVNNAGVLAASDYKPFGEPIVVTPAVTGVRKGFIDKEQDAESGNYNMGVRQLDDDRLISIDPKWEHFRAWTPYHYSFNNPLRLKDPSGEFPVAGAIAAFVADHAVAIGISLIVTGAIVHQVTLREYTSSNQNLSTSVAGPIPQRHSPFDEGIGAAIVQSLDAVTPLGVMDALQALAETYNDAEPGEPSAVPGPDGETENPAMPPIPVDPSEAPGPDWIWKGNGPPGSAEGNWVNEQTLEKLRPELGPNVHGPHWDYTDSEKRNWRIYPDGQMERKIRRGKPQ